MGDVEWRDVECIVEAAVAARHCEPIGITSPSRTVTDDEQNDERSSHSVMNEYS